MIFCALRSLENGMRLRNWELLKPCICPYRRSSKHADIFGWRLFSLENVAPDPPPFRHRAAIHTVAAQANSLVLKRFQKSVLKKTTDATTPHLASSSERVRSDLSSIL